MKKLILMMAIGSILSLTAVTKTQAQIKLPAVKITSPDELPEKVATAFTTNFGAVEKATWMHPNRNYVVSFFMDNTKHNALFAKNGALIYHIVYGNQRHIPEDLKSMVAEKFDGYDIIAAININQAGRSVWRITGEGKKDFLNVSIEDGVMSGDDRSRRYAGGRSGAAGRPATANSMF